jgi:DME family drug/metabolite transporter
MVDRASGLNLKGYLYIIAAASLWGILGPFSRLAFSQGLTPMEVAFWRAVLAWVFFGIHAVAGRTVRMRLTDLPVALLFAITGITMFFGFYQMAIRSGGAAVSSVLLYTAPAWVAVLARWIFRERFTRAKVVALGLTLLGVACVARGGGTIRVTLPAMAFGLGAGFCYSLYYIFGKYFSTRYTSANLFFYLLPVGALTLLPWVEFTPKSPTAWGALLCIAGPSTYGAYFCYYRGVKYLEASRAAIAATLEPVVAAGVAFFWWNEAFSITGYAGSAMIVAAVLMTVMDRDAGQKIA